MSVGLDLEPDIGGALTTGVDQPNWSGAVISLRHVAPDGALSGDAVVSGATC